MASLDYAHRRLVNALGPERVARGELERMVYSHDFASLPKAALLQWQLYPDFVVLPQTTEEVAAVVRLSDETGLPITPRGSGTGTAGGSVPNRGGVLVDLRKMNRVLAFDADDRKVTVEAGATWEAVAAQIATRGFVLPVEPVSAPSSTIGGGISNGAVGFGAYRRGSLRDMVLDLEVVLPDGRVVHTASPGEAGRAFADLTPLFFGAEGTLGIVTKATLRVDPKPEEARAAAYAFPDDASATSFVVGIVEAGVAVHHATFLDRDHFVFERALTADTPDPAPIVLASLRGPKDEVLEQEKTLDGLAGPRKGTKLAADVAARQWARRFTVYGARRLSRGLVVSANLVPTGRLGEAVAEARGLIERLRLNGAVQASLLSPTTASLAPYVLMDETVPSGGTALGFVKKMGDAAIEMDGHPMGLGLLLVFNLERMHGRAARSLGAVKEVFDPGRKINGGKTVELWTKFTVPILNSVPPSVMGFGLELAAFLRRIKPTKDRFVAAYERERGA